MSHLVTQKPLIYLFFCLSGHPHLSHQHSAEVPLLFKPEHEPTPVVLTKLWKTRSVFQHSALFMPGTQNRFAVRASKIMYNTLYLPVREIYRRVMPLFFILFFWLDVFMDFWSFGAPMHELPKTKVKKVKLALKWWLYFVVHSTCVENQLLRYLRP